MARSLKKGPFIDYKLEAKISAMVTSGKKLLSKHGHADQ